jgi:tRNA A-37 threonylcarbamoyl transferase component Bud32
MEPHFDETVRPERVGPYRLEEPIGRGGMGTVWRAWDERLKRRVAIKHIRTDSRFDELHQRLWREAQAAARLNHPAIVHIYDLVEDPAGDWIVMEMVEGKTLQKLTRDKGGLPVPQAVRLGLDIAEGLVEAHSHGILHRDLKTSNVMVTAAGRAKILDFGLAKQLSPGGEDPEQQDVSITMPGTILGTCYAMSPEQVHGRPLDGRSDLFSLGSLLYEIVTGEPPFRAATSAASLASIVSFHPPPLAEVRPGVPPALSDLVARLLEKDCNARPQSAAEAAAVLAVLAGAGSPVEESQPSTIAERHPLLGTTPRGTGTAARRTIGEHRLLTVVCCGLVRLDEGSGEAAFLDPEDLSEAMAGLHALAKEVCGRFSGRLGDTLGHRFWLYFGYPQAREDDARRAVQAARELAARSAEIGPGFGSWTRQRTSLRIAVHTGLAVVSIRPGQEEKLQPGPLLEITAGLQDLAPAGAILVTAASRPLIARAFLTEELPAVRLPGSAGPVAVSRVVGEVDPRQEDDAPLAPLVGRKRELELLLDRYRLARAGTGQAVMVSGEPGIGKSRLLKDLRDRLTPEGAAFHMAFAAPAAQGSPLDPILDLLARTIFDTDSIENTADPEGKLRRLESFLAAHGAAAEIALLLAPLLGLSREAQAPARGAHPTFERKKLFEALVALFVEMAEHSSLVLVIEDLHWADPSTLELLGSLLDEIPGSSLLLVATFRPEFQAPWGHSTQGTQLGLSRLTETDATDLIDRLLDRSAEPLPQDVRQQILARTDGVPLFIEELTRTLLETGRPGEPLEIPATLSGSLTARLDRPGPAKEVAQIASVIGRTFSPDLLAAIAPLDGAALEQGLDELVRAGLVHRRGVGGKARYSFKHALIQDAAYASLLSRDRQELHLKIAQALEAESCEAGLLAHHWARAVSPRNPEPALVRRAIPSLLAAGEHTLRLGAYQEARAHLEAALALVQTLPDLEERDEQELPLLVLLCRTLQASLGYISPEVAAVYERARGLRLRLGQRREVSQLLYMLWVSRLFEGDHEQALEFAREWLAGAERSGRGVLSAHGAISHSLYCLGRLPECLWHAETVLASPPREQDEFLMDYGLPPRVGAAYYSAWALVQMGMEREATARYQLAVELAEKHLDPFGMAMALGASLTYHIRRHDLPAVLRTAEQMKNQAVELGIPGEESLADRALSWALAESGDLDALRDFLTSSGDRKQRQQRVNGKLEHGWACHQIAVLLLRAGRLEDAGKVLEKGWGAVRKGEFLIEAHLGCLQGELCLALARRRQDSAESAGAQDILAAAEAHLREAFAVACRGLQPPAARRVLSHLGPLLVSQGRSGEAADLQVRIEELQAEAAERVQQILAETGGGPR